MLLPILCVALAGLSDAVSLKHHILPRQNGSAPSVDGSTAGPAAMTGVATFVDFVHEANTGRTVHGELPLEVSRLGLVPVEHVKGQLIWSILEEAPLRVAVTNQGGIAGDATGVGQSIIVQIIDACPATNAWNFCKTDQPDTRQKCMDPGTNSLDIEQNAYTGLTGQAYAMELSQRHDQPFIERWIRRTELS
ncbi:MAG: hypothetical protein Q9181_003344 [Wetmoreana brouardii]